MSKSEQVDVTYHAGFPNAAEDRSGFGLSLDQLVVRHRESTYFWQLAEDVIPHPGWLAGDIVVVDRSLHPKAGNWVVAAVDEEFTLCRYRSGNRLERADGTEVGESTIWGTVTYVLQRADKR